jgi:threonine dehydratase
MDYAQSNSCVTREEIRQFYPDLVPHIRKTPVICVNGSEFGLDPVSLWLKLELLQHTGSFKARGAITNLLTKTVPRAGVVAASGGNHGVAVAFAAKKFDVPARIYVPTVASIAKIDRIRGYGAELVVGGELYADAYAESQKWAAQTGAMAIHAYDQRETLLGQGTAGLEFEDQAPEIDTLLVAVGGGGLIGGISAWYAGRIRIIGVEPDKAPTLTRALEAGRPIDAAAGGIAADSLAPRRVGALMFPLAQKFVERVLLVSDEEIKRSQQALWKEMRIAAEPGGAAAFAALLSRKYQAVSSERVGVVICGGNTDAVDFSK